jgi:hypothetical protein
MERESAPDAASIVHPRRPRRRRLLAGIVAAVVTATALAVPLVPEPASAAGTPEFTDSFNDARDADPTYGLNDSISTRQSGPGKGVTYTRVHGNWSTPAATPPSYASQVNHSDFAGKLSFWAQHSAVRLDAPAMTDAADSYTVTAKVNPNANALGADADWVSLMLAKTGGSTGYVTATTVDAGLTVSRNGKVMLYQRGTALWSSELLATRSATGFDVTITVSNASTTSPSLAVAVNGATRTATLTGALVQPYVLLGAYLSNGSATTTAEVSTVDDLTVSRVAQFADNFDGANVYASDYGLNQNLGAREPGLAMPLTYSRVPGHWSNTATPPATYSQVNNPSFPNQLSFWVAPSAVKLDMPVSADSAGAFEIRATVKPDPGSFGGATDWVSIMLSSSSTGRGYVTDAQNQFSMTVARDGTVALYRGGVLVGSTFSAPIRPSGFAVTIRATDAGATPDLEVNVNGATRTTSLTAALKKPYLYLGAYISNGSATQLREVSAIDDLTISRVDPFPTLKYFGTYGTRNDDFAGNHVPDMKGIANLHWINVSPTLDASPLSYDTAEFAACPPKGCILYVGSEFFTPQTAQQQPNLNRWNGFVQMLQPYKDKIAAYYLEDEAYLKGVTYQQLDWSAKAVQASIDSGDIPDLPIMFTMTYIDIANSVAVPPDVDWYGMDAYNMTETELEWSANRLEQMASDQNDKIYLFPPNVPDTWNTWTTEAQILDRQFEYLRVANRHPRVIALLNFGLWVNTGAAGSSPRPQTYVPRVFALQERVGAAIMSRP